MPKHEPADPAITETAWQDIILICRKCSKKTDGGFGPDNTRPLARELKRALRAAGRRKAFRVLETKCLGLCPKGAVTLLSTTNPGHILTVPAGTDPLTLLARLLPPP